MSPCCGSMCLLVLLGAVMAFGSPVQSEERFNNLLRLKEVEVGSKPLFDSVINTVCQRDIQLINATLDVYMRIFSSILQHSHQQHHGHTSGPALLKTLSSPDERLVRSELSRQQQMMEALREKLDRLNHNEDIIQKLNKIKVDVPIDQRKALAEFKRVYSAASQVGCCNSSVH